MSNEREDQLRRAARDGDVAAVEAALAAGAAIDARGDYGDTALNEAANEGHREVVGLLLDRGANIENIGGADMTPLMNAAVKGHVELTSYLINRGARITNDLLSTMEFKVKIFREQAEEGYVTEDGLKAWESFLEFIGSSRLQQDMGEIAAGLGAGGEAGADALRRIKMAAERQLDLSEAVPALKALRASSDADTRFEAAKALATEAARTADWALLGDLLAAGDDDTKAGALGVAVAAARDGANLMPLLPAFQALTSDVSLEMRHDTPIALGFLATNGHDVRAALPELKSALYDQDATVRQMALWALYRIAKHVGSVAPLMFDIRARLEDANDDVRSMAEEAVKAAEEAGE